jgi:cob(I)alamin adenosyltransferase
MTVNLTRIYTRLGDGGQTHLGDMSRVSKTDARVEAYGTVDELNAEIGLARIQPDMPGRFDEWLGRVQNELLDLGADLCVPGAPPDSPARTPIETGSSAVGGEEVPAAGGGEEAPAPPREPRSRLRVTPDYTTWLESACDEVNERLPPLRSFVIPGGSPAAAHLHVCRTVCRRAERRAIAVGSEVNGEVVRYLNRLSDLLFILARAVGEGDEALWEPGAHHGGADGPSAASE